MRVGGEGGDADGVGRPVESIWLGERARADRVDEDDVVDARDRGGDSGSPPAAKDCVDGFENRRSARDCAADKGLTVARDESDKTDPTRGRVRGSLLRRPILDGPADDSVS